MKSVNIYAPKYKKLLRLKEPSIIGSKIMKLHKEKWSYSKQRYLKKRVKAFDHAFLLKPRRGFFFNKSYLFELIEKQKISSAYGNIRLSYWKSALTASAVIKAFETPTFLRIFCTFEKRLDTILVRCGFARSFRESRKILTSKKIEVNGFVVTSCAYSLSTGDSIKVHFNPSVFPQPPVLATSTVVPYCEIDYRLGKILIFDTVTPHKLSTLFPIKFEQDKLIRYLKKA